jgi:hypothetical protein
MAFMLGITPWPFAAATAINKYLWITAAARTGTASSRRLRGRSSVCGV